MIYALFAISLLLSVGLTIIQRYIEYFPLKNTRHFQPSNSYIAKTIARNFFRSEVVPKDDKASQVKVALLKGFKNFFISFSVVALFFACLQFWLQRSSYSYLSQKTILQIEVIIRDINKRFASFDRFKYIPEIVLLGLLIAMAFSWPVIERLKLKAGFEGFMKAVSYFLGLITLATSFTFFGREFKKAENGVVGKLRIHEFSIIKDNKLLLKLIQEDVKKKVIEEFLNDETISDLYNEKESVIKASDSLLTSTDYEYYKEYETRDDSTIIAFFSYFEHPGDVSKALEAYNAQFLERNNKLLNEHNARLQNKPVDYVTKHDAGEIYESFYEYRYDTYVKEQSVEHSILSEKKVADATKIFNSIKESAPPVNSILNDQYGELVKKTFNDGYSLTIKGWVDDFATGLINIPFLGEFLAPFHEVMQDFVYDKAKRVYAFVCTGNADAAKQVMQNIGKELKTKIKEISDRSGLVKRIKDNSMAVYKKINLLGSIIKERNIITQALAEQHFRTMKSSSRWQGIRDEFARIARIEKVAVYPSEPFTREQWKEFDEVLNNWNNYMNENKMSWFKERSHGLEYYFYDYIRGHPKACGAWGFILQQADWNRAVSYYSANPDPGATGKPYYLLKYYCNESRQGSIDELYTDEVNERGVSIFCPH